MAKVFCSPSFFVITSAFTVGYGEIYPRTFWGKVLIIAMFFMIVVFVPQNVRLMQGSDQQVITIYRLKKHENESRDRCRLENKTRKRHIILTGYCTYRDVSSTLIYQWREDFSGDDYLGRILYGFPKLVAVLNPNLNMNDFRHSPYWKHRFVMRVQFFKGTVFNHVFPFRKRLMSE